MTEDDTFNKLKKATIGEASSVYDDWINSGHPTFDIIGKIEKMGWKDWDDFCKEYASYKYINDRRRHI